MTYNFAGGGDDDQVFLMPPDPRDWLPEGHLARAMRVRRIAYRSVIKGVLSLFPRDAVLNLG
jgi:hypothetical protein